MKNKAVSSIRGATIAVVGALFILFGSCNRKALETTGDDTEIEFTVELKRHCILRSLALVFKPGGMQDIRGRYRGDKPITVIFSGFPHDSYPKRFGKHKLIRLKKEDAARRLEEKETLSFMEVAFVDRPTEGRIVVDIGTHGYSLDHERDVLRRAHGESAWVDFLYVDGGLDSGTLTGTAIE